MDDPGAAEHGSAQENVVPEAMGEGQEAPSPAESGTQAWQDSVPDVGELTAVSDPAVSAEPAQAAIDPQEAAVLEDHPEAVPEAEAAPGTEADTVEQAEAETEAEPAAGVAEAPEALLEGPAESAPEAPEAPETDAAETQAAVAEAAPIRRRSPVPWWPYLAYIGCWGALAAGLVLAGVQTGDSYLPDNSFYPILLLAGLTLAVCGPLLGVFAWMLARRRLDEGERTGLLTAAFLRASMFTLGGVVLWWLAIVLVDALRLDWL